MHDYNEYNKKKIFFIVRTCHISIAHDILICARYYNLHEFSYADGIPWKSKLAALMIEE